MFTGVGLSHAKDVALYATQCVADYDDSTIERTVANDATLAVILAVVFDLDRRSCEDLESVVEVESAMDQRLLPLVRS